MSRNRQQKTGYEMAGFFVYLDLMRGSNHKSISFNHK